MTDHYPPSAIISLPHAPKYGTMMAMDWKSFFKKRAPQEKKVREVSVFREYFELIAETLVYVFFVTTFLLQSFVIPTSSMEDTLLVGDHLLVNKVAYSRSISGIDRLILPQTEIRRGMVVTFKAPPEMDKEFVKRVIALPGETISIVNKKVFINGSPLDEPYTYFKDPNIESGFRDNFPPYVVPENSFFCMGDNRDNSFDCRYWGTVPADYLIGKPWRIYWSYDSTSAEYLTPGVFNKIKDLAVTAINFFTKTRWLRTTRKIV
jgi:signal peptidase I